MIDHDSSFNSKQIHDILNHICQQNFDFTQLTHPFPIVDDTTDIIVAWDFFKSLSLKERFYKLYQCLNENNFKFTCFSFLNIMKSSSFGVTNGTFICLRSHLENLLNHSQRILDDPRKADKSKENLKFFEFDERTRWNPERSEWLLNNICMRSALASMFVEVNFQQNNELWKNIFLIGSSTMVFDVDVLQREVEMLLDDQFRCMQIKLTSPNEVEESARQINEGSRHIPQALTAPGKYTFIATFTLAAFIARQIQSSILTFYRCSISDISVNSTKNVGLKSRVVLCDPTPDYLLTCLSAEDDDSRSVMQLSSFYILSKWKELSAEEKLSFLAQLGFISQRENQQNQKNRNKSQKSLAEQSKYLECIQLEFTHWYSDLPQIQECIPLIAETDFEALEAGVFSQESTTQEKFVSWCNSHSNLGSELCEYVSYCPLIKLFSPAGIDPGFFWYRWATKAFSELEHMYNHHVGDSNLVALFSNDGAVVKNSKKAKIKKPQVKEIPSKKTETNGKKAKKPKNNRDSSVAKESKVEVSIAPIVLAQSKCVESIVEDRTIIDEEYLLLEQSNLPESSNFDNFAQSEHHTTNVEAATVERTTFDSTSRMDSDSLSSSSSKSEESFPPCQAQSDGEDLRDLTECSHQELEQKQEQELLRDNSQDMTSAVTTTNASPVEPEQKKNSDPKRNGGEFLGPECQIFSKKSKKIPTERTEKSVESQTDSHGRVDLIQWDQQRRLTEILTEDILDMASNLYKIAQLRRPWQSAAIERVRVAVQSIWPQAQCDIFGSFGTGLAIPSSDVDIVVTGVINQLQWWGGKAITPLAILSQHLQLQDWVSTVRAIEHTLMPVIKITTAPVPMPSLGAESRKDYRGVIKIDISISSSVSNFGESGTGASFHHSSFTAPDGPSYTSTSLNPYSQPSLNSYQSPGHGQSFSSNSMYHYSPQSQTFANFTPISSPPVPSSGVSHQGVSTRDFVLRLCAMNPSIIPLVLVMKQFLQEKGLHDPFTGGLSSYAVTIMMASILQPYALERPELHPDLGTLFLSFLKRYGTDFDTRKYAVVLSINGPFVPLAPGAAFAHVPRVGTPNYWKPAEPVVVTDPLNSQNNLGRSCFGFRQIQTEFDNALERALSCLEDDTLSSICSEQPPSGPDSSMGKIFNSNRKSKSVLGAIFGTQHHDSVVKLQAQIWCPLEVWSPNSNLNMAKNNNVEPQRPPSLKRDSLSLRLVRKECEELLASIPDTQLEEVKNMLIGIKEKDKL